MLEIRPERRDCALIGRLTLAGIWHASFRPHRGYAESLQIALRNVSTSKVPYVVSVLLAPKLYQSWMPYRPRPEKVRKTGVNFDAHKTTSAHSSPMRDSAPKCCDVQQTRIHTAGVASSKLALPTRNTQTNQRLANSCRRPFLLLMRIVRKKYGVLRISAVCPIRCFSHYPVDYSVLRSNRHWQLNLLKHTFYFLYWRLLYIAIRKPKCPRELIP